MTGELEKEICCVHIRVSSIFGKVFTLVVIAWPVRGYAVNADKVDLRFELQC